VKQPRSGWKENLQRTKRLGVAVALCFGFALSFAAPALATYEHVATFGDSGEVAFGNFGGPAPSVGINTTGVGGVPPGTVYVATANTDRVLRYSATGEFQEAWGWGVAEPPAKEFQRCGPAGEAAHPVCGTEAQGGEGEGQFAFIKGLAVDQSTGDVYVYSFERKHGVIQVFNADGSELITSFGERTAAPSFDEEPSKFHLIGSDTPIAVDNSGEVFAVDGTTGSEMKRIMTFRPQSPGDYQHYVYAGRAADFEITRLFEHMAVDDVGDLFISSETNIYEFGPGQSEPTCKYPVPGGGAFGMTVNPANGEVFYFSYKDRKIHQLSSCGSDDLFKESAAFPVARKTEGISSLAFNSAMTFEPSRPPGILYGFDEQEPTQAEIFAPAEVRSPVVESESVSGVGSSDASLNARINPKGSEARYVFEYLTAAAFQANEPAERFAGATDAPIGGAALGSGQSALSAQVGLASLSPATEYKFRVIATSNCNPQDETELCVTAGEAASFRTYPVSRAGLPDDRAYELVSPASKRAGEVFPINGTVGTCEPVPTECKPGALGEKYPRQVASDGESVVYEGSPFSMSGGAPVLDEYLSTRTGAGWTTVNLTPELLGGQFPNGYKEFNPDLTESLILQGRPTLTPSAPFGYGNLYLQPTANPLALSSVLRVAPPNRTSGSNGFNLTYGGSSGDFSRLFFAANDALTGPTQFSPAATNAGPQALNLYEDDGGEIRLVNVLPGNTETAPGASFGARSVDGVSDVSRLLATDGSRVFWTSEDGQIFVRENATTTREVSESQRTVPDPIGSQPAEFLAASPDGSRALFSSPQELTDGADTGSIEQTIVVKATAGTFTISFGGQATAALEFDATSEQMQTALAGLSTIGPGAVDVSEPQTGKFTVRFISPLASTEQLLTVDGANLTGTANASSTRTGQELYEWDNGVVRGLTDGHGLGTFMGMAGQSENLSTIYFVDSAVLDGQPNEQGEAPVQGGPNLYLYKGGRPVFIATLAGADNSVNLEVGDWQSAPQRRTAESSPNGRWLAFLSRNPLTKVDSDGQFEAFLYDSNSGRLICASCNPTGAEPFGSTTLPIQMPAGGMANVGQQQYLTDAGRLYFDSRDALTPFDTNHGVEDVYQYEPSEVGSCTREGGCVALMSAGTSAVDSNFLAIDATGSNVFFTTRDQLSPRDRDESIDLYDARENGGINAESETIQSECQGEACQPAPVGPDDRTPASANFEGPGNVAQKHHKKKHHRKKHHRKKHHAKRDNGRKQGGSK
jgi:hypothetical protein